MSLPTAPAHCLGPDYRPEEEKPTATVSKVVPANNVHVLKQTTQLIALLTYVFAVCFDAVSSPSVD